MIKVIERAHELYVGYNGFKTYGITVQDTTDKHRWCINAYSLKNTDVAECVSLSYQCFAGKSRQTTTSYSF